MSQPLRVAQITDTHLFADDRQTMFGCRTNLAFEQVIRGIRQLNPQPDILLLTGDLTQDETIASYEYLRSLVDPLQIPTYWVPGNHDQSLADMQQVLNSPFISPAKQFCEGGWNFILLNTMGSGLVQGRLAAAELDRLEQQLQTDRPTIVVLHHPPLPVGAECMDQIRLENAEQFFAVIDRFPQVKLVVFGHIHHGFETQRQSVHYIGTPSSCVQLKPLSQTFIVDDQPPGFRLFTLYPDGRYETEVRRVAIANV
jgi:3',5'-cyclic-AMP phosphodiesterase